MQQDLIAQVTQKLQDFFVNEIEIDFHDEKWDGKHFFLEITSEKFIGRTRVEQSQLVYSVLDEFMKTWYIHALRMKCRVPINS